MHSRQSQFGQRGGALRDINSEQKDTVQQLFESNSWPWNVELTNAHETESTALSASLEKPRPFVFKLTSLHQHDLAYRKLSEFYAGAMCHIQAM